jgi:hypothetical protein
MLKYSMRKQERETEMRNRGNITNNKMAYLQLNPLLVILNVCSLNVQLKMGLPE